MLQSAGLSVVTYSSGPGFLAALPDMRRDCVVLDIHMPGMAGFEVQERLAACAIPIPVIFITGRHESADEVRAMKAGAIKLLCKPFEERALLDVLEVVLQNGQSGMA